MRYLLIFIYVLHVSMQLFTCVRIYYTYLETLLTIERDNKSTFLPEQHTLLLP